jgi:hypothetical protein
MPCLWQVKAIVEYTAYYIGGDGDVVADAPRRHTAGVPLKKAAPSTSLGAAANMALISLAMTNMV